VCALVGQIKDLISTHLQHSCTYLFTVRFLAATKAYNSFTLHNINSKHVRNQRVERKVTKLLVPYRFLTEQWNLGGTQPK